MPITNVGGGVVAGTVAYFAAADAPAGWLKANGATVSRAAYGALFLAIGTTYGAGDGATTFKLPDLRGEFLRAADDGRGVDSGRALGSAQADGIKEGTLDAYAHGGAAYGALAAASGVVTLENASGWSVAAQGTANGRFSRAVIGKGGAETRPRNVALLACIKF